MYGKIRNKVIYLIFLINKDITKINITDIPTIYELNSLKNRL